MYEIHTYKEGFLSWITEATRTDQYKVPWMSLDPKPKDYDKRPLDKITMSLGYFNAMTKSGSQRRALQAIRKDQTQKRSSESWSIPD